MTKSKSRIVDWAIQSVDGFEVVFKVIHQHTVLQGKSPSTFQNYICRVAPISLHFNKLSEQISDDEVNECLTTLSLSSNSQSLYYRTLLI